MKQSKSFKLKNYLVNMDFKLNYSVYILLQKNQLKQINSNKKKV